MESNIAAELQKLLDASNAEKQDLQAQLSDVLAVNAALTLEIEKLTAEKSKTPAETISHVINLSEHSFTNDGAEYGFNYAKQVVDGHVITPVEVKASKELQDRLIRKKSSMIFKKQ